MKQFCIMIAGMIILTSTAVGQVGINNDSSNPDNSAMLDVKSSSKGLLIPRMTREQMSIIVNPANGLMVFNSTDSKLYVYISGLNVWKEISYGSSSISSIVVPSVTTSAVANITSNAATSGGNVTANGGANVTSRGVCWNTNPNPTIANFKTNDGTGTGIYESNLTSLAPNTLYYVRSFATNIAGTAYGNEFDFSTNCASYATVGVAISPSANTVCDGIPVTFAATPVNGGFSPACQWTLNGTPVNGATNSTYVIVPVNGDAVSCILTSNAVCVTGNPATSNTVIITVNPLQPVSVSIEASANPVCAGSPVDFTATPANGGAAPSYQWKINGTNTNGATNATFSYVPTNGDAISCILTSNGSCITGNPATSNEITMTVYAVLPVSFSIVASSNPCIMGSSVTFTATAVNGGSAPGFQWQINGLVVGVTNNSFTYAPSEGDVVTCVSISNLPCSTGNPAISNSISMMVLPGLPCPGVQTVTYEGQTYNTVLIGTQCWLRENLNVGIKTNGVQEQTNNNIREKYCYDNLETNCDIYGGLYQWGEVVQYLNGGSNVSSWSPEPSGFVQGICPSEWHIPSQSEWIELSDAYGGLSVSGGKIKESGTTHWQTPNTGATNESGFTAKSGGHSSQNGSFHYLGTNAYFWTSSEHTPGSPSIYSWYFFPGYDTESLGQAGYYKALGFSVRCIKDCSSAPNSPASGTHTSSQTQIIWNWNTVNGATGYKWNTTNDYATATDMGTVTTKTETGLTPGTSYSRYIWGYNSCGASTVTTLTSQATAFAVGQSYGGGIIFYIYQSGDLGYVAGQTHGLISSTADQSTYVKWGCYGISISGTISAIGSGPANTTLIVANGCSNAGNAAKVCNDIVINGYTDWFLPSRFELVKMWEQKDVIGGFTNNYYWSSTEYNATTAWFVDFNGSGYTYDPNKNNLYYVRAIRAF